MLPHMIHRGPTLKHPVVTVHNEKLLGVSLEPIKIVNILVDIAITQEQHVSAQSNSGILTYMASPADPLATAHNPSMASM